MVLSAANITKSYGADTVIENISFSINNGDKLGIVGVNGAGKTTLFKIITGELDSDKGSITTPQDITLGYLSQLNDLDPENTLEEEFLLTFAHIIALEEKISELSEKMALYSGKDLEQAMAEYERLNFRFEQQNGYEYKSRVRGVIAGLGFSGEAEKKTGIMSGGQKTRIALGKLLLSAPDVLLLDEPTNHLDIESIKWLEDFIRSYPKSVIIISHDRYFLDKTVTKILEIENKHANSYSGNYSFYAREKGILRQNALKRYLDQQKIIKKQEESIRLLKSFNKEKQVKRAESKEKQLAKLERLDKPENLPDKIRINLELKNESGNDVLFAENISKSFGEKKLFSGLNFEIKKGDKIALIGPNGIGKTTLFKIILELLESDTGKITFGHRVRTGYYDQGQQELSEEKTILEEISDAYPKLTTGEIRNVLAAFVFTGDDVFKRIDTLSGGEKGRVSLAKIMLSGANLLLLDEPTNHLDIHSKEILEDALSDYPGTLMFISHDRYFINRIADKVFEMDNYSITPYMGDYNYYLDKKEAQAKLETEAAPTKQQAEEKNNWQLRKDKDAASRKQRNRLKKLETEIENTEKQIETFAIEMESPEIASDYEKSHELYIKKEDAENLLLELYEEFDSLNQLLL